MNIQEAKKEIVRTLRAYTKTDRQGKCCIPVEKQRPVLLIGPPGIGKTAIMEQIATEEDVGLVAYTMTHHTRQSAIGLPIIEKRTYHGQEYSVTRYTMSEIIASIYEKMEETGKKTGILFLDEINCVSETLSPVMLQLLQNKMFGTHAMPEGWLIVAAGNPPEYNKSVREFDMATLDRVKNIDVEADLEVWQNYAAKKEIHPAVRAYLTVHPEHFYVIEEKKTGKLFVTARGWEDLSCILKIYEEDGELVTEEFVFQYLQHDEVARGFYLFYDLFHGMLEKTADTTVSNDDTGMINVSKLWMGIEEQIQNMDVAETLGAAAVFADEICGIADAWQKEEKHHKILGEELKHWKKIPQGKWEARIVKRKEALGIKRQYGLLNVDETVEEEKIIRELEDVFHKVKKEKIQLEDIDPVMCESDQGDSKIQLKLDKKLLELIEKAYEILKKASDRTAEVYFTADLSQSDACCRFLVSHKCEAYEENLTTV